MDRSVTRLLPLFAILIWVVSSHVFAAQVSTTKEDALGRDVLTIQTANRRFRLVIEEIDKTSGLPEFDDEDEELTLTATMFSGEGESGKSIWRTQLSGNTSDYNDDELLVSEDGTFFITLPERWSYSDSKFSIYTANAVERVTLARYDNNEVERGQWIKEYERIGSKDVLRFWDQQKDRWLAFTVPDGDKFEVTDQIAERWNEFTRRKILDAIYQRKQEQLRARLREMAPRLNRLTTLLARNAEAPAIDSLHYQFLLRRKNPADRKIFETMLESEGRYEPIPLSCFSSPQIYQNQFKKGSGERELADDILAEWDGKRPKGSSKNSDSHVPYLLSRLSGRLQLPAPILNKAGYVRIHLIPEKKRNAKWTSDAAVEELVCSLNAPSPWQSDLSDAIQFSFRTVNPGKFYLKAVWDKRPPNDDLTSAGAGDYESDLIGPIALNAGGLVTNIVINCTNRAPGGEAYYATDAAAWKMWKVTGELSPASFSGSNQYADYFSRPARDWFIATNQPAPANAPKIVRLALGTTISMLWNGSQVEERTLDALKVYLLPDSAVIPQQGKIEIIDAHGCSFTTAQPYDWPAEHGWRQAAVFANYPREAKTFRLVAWGNSDTNKIAPVWDYTVTNLMRTNAVKPRGEQLPLTKDFGRVILTISALKIGEEDFRVERQFFLKDGSPAAGWKLLDQQLLDDHGSEVVGHGFCREDKGLVLRGAVARKAKMAPQAWNLKFTELPGPGKFLALDIKTNLAGVGLRLLGIAGTGRTVFRLPIAPSDRSPSASGEDFEVDLESNRATMKSKTRVAIVEGPADIDGAVVYVRRVGRLDKQEEVQSDTNRRLFFLPLRSVESDGSVDLEFRADETIPLKLVIDPSTNVHVARINFDR
jgi:hypothetical protein